MSCYVYILSKLFAEIYKIDLILWLFLTFFEYLAVLYAKTVSV